MSTIDNIGNGNVTNSTGSTNGLTNTKVLGKDDFLKMLLAQLKNQDPLNPMQGTEFSSQLAQFSSLEQLTNLNAAVTAQSNNTANLINVQSISLIGKGITAKIAEGTTGTDGTAGTTVTGQVTAVNFKNQSIYLTVNGQDIPFSDVLSVQ